MTVRRIAAIYSKDLLDAIRDARILVTLVTPLLIGIFYAFAFDDDTTPSATLVVSNPGNSTLVTQLVESVQGQVDLFVESVAPDSAVQDRIAADHGDLGLVIPRGFDQAIVNGQQPELQIYLPERSSIGGQYVLANLEPILRTMAGQRLPVNIQVESVALDPANLTLIDKMSLRTWSIVLSLLLMVAMVALLAVPIILAEETEKKTIDALVLISSYGEIVAAKALLGATYVAVMSVILLAITRLEPVTVGGLLLALAALSVCLLGFGLLIGSVFKSATQLNTWSGLLLLPALVPATIIGLGLPDWIERIAGSTPTGAGMKLLVDAFSDPRVFDERLESLLVLGLWSVIFYALLLWQLSRRRA